MDFIHNHRYYVYNIKTYGVATLKYFSNLKNGWADLTIGDFHCPCSYIQNVPIQILNAWKEFQKNHYCIITIDSEGYENEIIITENGIHVLVYKDCTLYYNLNKYFETLGDKVGLLKDLVDDILSNIDEWVRWLCITDPDSDCYENVINEYKDVIMQYAERLNLC